jgi:capsular polysaccharide export protein
VNVAYLDPPYSRYFHVLARHLCERMGGGNVVALLSSPSYRLYTAGDRSLLWSPGRPTQRTALPPAIERASWAPGLDVNTLQETFSHAVEWFKARFAEERTEVCLVFSDARPFSAAARIAADALGVTCMYFERGAFRYRTSSLGTSGLNARFDLLAVQRASGVKGLSEEELPARRPTEAWLRLRFLLFMLHHGLAGMLQPARRAMHHKRYHFFNYLRIAWSEMRSRAGEPTTPVARGEQPVVLLPLQLPTDSQFVLHSPFRHNQELLDFVVDRARQALPRAEVLVKKHPMDVRSYRLPEGARFIEGHLGRYYAAADCVVCINSTAGFEAAVHGKPVVCFGRSFYTSHRLVTRATRENFHRRLASAVARGDDPAAGRELRAAVLRYYQAPGDVWAYTADDLRRTADIVLQQFQAADVGRSAAVALAVIGAAGARRASA